MVDLFTFSVDELSCDVNSDFWPETIIVSRVVSPLPIGLSVEDFATVDVFFALVVDTPSEFLIDLLLLPLQMCFLYLDFLMGKLMVKHSLQRMYFLQLYFLMGKLMVKHLLQRMYFL